MPLTEEQKQRIAANRAAAVARQQQNQARLTTTRPSVPPPVSNPAPSRPPVSHVQRPPTSSNYSRAGRLSGSFKRGGYRFNKTPYPNFYGARQNSSNFSNSAATDGPSTSTASAFKSLNTVNLSIFNAERFKVETRPFIDAVTQYIRSQPDRVYENKEKCWSFPWKAYNDIKQGLKNIKNADFNVEELLPSVLEYFRNRKAAEEPDPNNLASLKVTMWNTLHDYQKEGIIQGIKNGGRILIADEMGLGKSIQALGLAFYYRTEWPLLIVAPSSVKGSWKEQIEQFLPDLCQVHIIEKSRDMVPTARSTNLVVIISYDMMVRKQEYLLQNKFYVIIFDESHMLKEMLAKRTKAATRLAFAANRVVLLSGTPAISRPAELFSQIQIIDRKLFPNWMDFATTYCDGRQTMNGFIARGATKTQELTTILQEAIMIRRTKDKLILPKKIRHFTVLSEKNVDTQMKALQDVKVQAEHSKGKELHTTLMEYYRITALVKSSAVTSFLQNEYIKNGIDRKMLIFAHHLVVLDAISSMLVASEISFIRIDGTTQNRTALVEKFQTDKECKIAVLSMTAAGVGITLTAATIVIFAELHWNPATLMQAEDRAHRMGQKHTVDVFYIIANKTADDDMLKLLKKKITVLNAVDLNTGALDNSHQTYEDPGATKITSFFERLSASQSEKAKNKNHFAPGEVIDIESDDEAAPLPVENEENNDVKIDEEDDDWFDDDFMVNKTVAPKKRESDDGCNEVPLKRAK